jgi:hypothetical protein
MRLISFSPGYAMQLLSGLAHCKYQQSSRADDVRRLVRALGTFPAVVLELIDLVMAKPLFWLTSFAPTRQIVTASPANGAAVYLLEKLFMLEEEILGPSDFLWTGLTKVRFKSFQNFIGNFLYVRQAPELFLEEAVDSIRERGFSFFVARAFFDGAVPMRVAGFCTMRFATIGVFRRSRLD